MLFSMTGYGRGSAENNQQIVSSEIRSVNHRFLDISVRLPKNYIWLEESCVRTLKSLFGRGRLDCFIQIRQKPEVNLGEVRINQGLLREYLRSFKEIKRMYRLPGRLRLEHLLTIPELFISVEPEEDRETLEALVSSALQKAAQELLEMRKREGEIISGDLISRVETLGREISGIEKVAQELPAIYRRKITKLLNEVIGENSYDENRLSTEVVLYAERSTITEEIVRFKSHLEQFKATMELREPIGRKLDFLTQELHREINTIASKTSDLTISHHVVEIKTEIEKIREQIQNIE